MKNLQISILLAVFMALVSSPVLAEGDGNAPTLTGVIGARLEMNRHAGNPDSPEAQAARQRWEQEAADHNSGQSGSSEPGFFETVLDTVSGWIWGDDEPEPRQPTLNEIAAQRNAQLQEYMNATSAGVSPPRNDPPPQRDPPTQQNNPPQTNTNPPAQPRVQTQTGSGNTTPTQTGTPSGATESLPSPGDLSFADPGGFNDPFAEGLGSGSDNLSGAEFAAGIATIEQHEGKAVECEHA